MYSSDKLFQCSQVGYFGVYFLGCFTGTEAIIYSALRNLLNREE